MGKETTEQNADGGIKPDRINQQALKLIERGFPLSLELSLDPSGIVTRIPVSYSRK